MATTQPLPVEHLEPELKDEDDKPLTYVSQHPLDPQRVAILGAAFPEIAAADRVVAILARSGDQPPREFTAVSKGGGPAALVMGSCQITYADITPAECVLYSFAEQPGVWRAAQLSLEAMESYRDMKFQAWQKMLRTPDCEAQLRRMLQIGCVSRLYDRQIFPTPEDLTSLYEVTDDKNGKIIKLPHPVGALQLWDAAEQKYRELDPITRGAPAEHEKAAWWAGFLEELRQQHGQEYIDGLLGK